MIRTNPIPPANDQRGIALLLSLLLIAALVAAGIGASNVVINEFRTVGAADRSMIAYYSADSGIEHGLYTMYNNRLRGTSYTCTANGGAGCSTAGITNLTGTLEPFGTPGTYSMSRSLSDSQQEKTLTLKSGETIQLSLYDPDDPFDADSSFYTPSQILRLQADNVTCTAPLISPCARAEVQWTYLLREVGNLVTFRENTTKRILSDASVQSGVELNFVSATIASPDAVFSTNPTGDAPAAAGSIVGWVVRIKALNGPLENLTVSAKKPFGDPGLPCSDNGSQYKCFSDDVLIRSIGETKDARILLEARVPWQAPTAGLYDFVLFSEETIDKPAN